MGRKWTDKAPGAPPDSDAAFGRWTDEDRSDTTPHEPQPFERTPAFERLGARVSSDADDRITAFAAHLRDCDATGASSVRQRLRPDIPVRIWHRVFPYLPREQMPDGSVLVWHPNEDGWTQAVDRVHANRPIRWRRSGAYVRAPGADRVMLHDFRRLDALESSDWSSLLPDPRFLAFVSGAAPGCGSLSEFVARWAFTLGPDEAGVALRRLIGI